MALAEKNLIDFEKGMIVLFNAQRADSSNSCILHSFTDKTTIAYQKIAIRPTETKRKFSRDRFHAVAKPKESRFILTLPHRRRRILGAGFDPWVHVGKIVLDAKE